MKTLAFFRILWYNVYMENREMQTSNPAEMVTISRAEYEQLQQENAQLEAKSAKLEEAHTRLEAKIAARKQEHTRLEAKFAAREQEQAQVITSLTLQNEWLREQWPYLTRYLEDGRLELSNNRAERSIKPFVMGRKNWLFANTLGGDQASSVIYSLIETAKANGLDPYRYLLWVLRNAPGLSETDEAWAEKLLPANAPEECYMPHK